MIYVYYFFAGLLIVISWKSLQGGLRYRRHFHEKLAGQPASPLPYRPFATVIAPYRGVDVGFAQNVARLFLQDYAAYEIVMVVDDEADVAVKYLTEAIAANSHIAAKLIVAPHAKTNAQKAENLREGVLGADSRSEVLVFVDSDARVPIDWLSSLIAPLASPEVGASTGYRWFVSDKVTLANELLSVWNASIASAFGPNPKSNFTWGGSTAIRRETFEKLDIRERWRTIVSDDFVLANAIRGAGLGIEFVPQALCASLADVSLRGLWEFTTRQMKLTRVYRTDLWALSLFGSVLFCGVMVASILLLIGSDDAVPRIIAATVVLAVTILSIAKAYIRTKAAAQAIPDYTTVLHRHLVTHCILFWATPTIFLANCLAALLSRTIRWRGTIYEMVSQAETRIQK